eukprot:114871-Ditylum_brightwellii.AAC.2
MQDQILVLQQSQSQLRHQLADKQWATTALSVATSSSVTSHEVERLMEKIGKDKPTPTLSLTPYWSHEAKEWLAFNMIRITACLYFSALYCNIADNLSEANAMSHPTEDTTLSTEILKVLDMTTVKLISLEQKASGTISLREYQGVHYLGTINSRGLVRQNLHPNRGSSCQEVEKRSGT